MDALTEKVRFEVHYKLYKLYKLNHSIITSLILFSSLNKTQIKGEIGLDVE